MTLAPDRAAPTRPDVSEPAPAAPLLPAHLRPLALAAAVVGGDVLAVMGAALHDTRDPTRFDSVVIDWLLAHLGPTVQYLLLILTLPALTVGTTVVVALGAATVHRWRVAALALVGPGLGLVLESAVLKPGIDRQFGLVEQLSHGAVKAGAAFPSGHQTGVTSVVAVLVVLLLRTGATRRTRAVLGTLAALWVFLGGVGLVRNLYHYPTDVVGGTALGVAVVALSALAIDAVADRLSSPAGRGRPRTTRAA